MVVIFGETRLDYKYRKFLGPLADRYKLVGFSDVVKLWSAKLSNKNCYYFHIRYLKWRGVVITTFYYFMLVTLCKLRGIKIVFTCHNYWEHNFKNRFVNGVVRRLLAKYAHAIVVLDKEIGNRIASDVKRTENKISVVHFSDFSDFFEAQKEKNLNFSKTYELWKRQRGIQSPDLLMISASYRSLDKFKNLFNNSKKNILCITPNLQEAEGFGENTLIYYKDFVKAEVVDILKEENRTIGLIGLDNGSVATSLYMFASYQKPMLVLDVAPMNGLIEEFDLGGLFSFDDDLDTKCELILQDYPAHQDACRSLLSEHTWDKSYHAHREIFKG